MNDRLWIRHKLKDYYCIVVCDPIPTLNWCSFHLCIHVESVLFVFSDDLLHALIILFSSRETHCLVCVLS